MQGRTSGDALAGNGEEIETDRGVDRVGGLHFSPGPELHGRATSTPAS